MPVPTENTIRSASCFPQFVDFAHRAEDYHDQLQTQMLERAREASTLDRSQDITLDQGSTSPRCGFLPHLSDGAEDWDGFHEILLTKTLNASLVINTQ